MHKRVEKKYKVSFCNKLTLEVHTDTHITLLVLNTTDIRIFVRFAIFEHNLCYLTIRLQPCGFAHVYFSTTWSWDAHNWWNQEFIK